MNLRELEQAATPAPWSAAFDKRVGAWRVHQGPCVTGEQDATLTAALRNAAPLMLDVVDAARAVLIEWNAFGPAGSHSLLNTHRVLRDALAALDAA